MAFGQTVLLEGVGEFELAYFGVAEEIGGLMSPRRGRISRPSPRRQGQLDAAGLGDEPEGQWYDEWVAQPHPPELVRVHLTSQRQGWPDSVIRLPRVDQAQGGAIQVGAPQAQRRSGPWCYPGRRAAGEARGFRSNRGRPVSRQRLAGWGMTGGSPWSWSFGSSPCSR